MPDRYEDASIRADSFKGPDHSNTGQKQPRKTKWFMRDKPLIKSNLHHCIIICRAKKSLKKKESNKKV